MTATRVRRAAAIAALLTALVGCSISVTTDEEDAAASASTPGSSDSSGTTAPARTFPDTPAQGVTDDTIRLGLAILDVEAIRETYGVDLGRLPDGVIDALVTATNEAGGINGRQIELVQRPVMPIGNEDSERACRELIEDEQVFAVAGMFLGDNPLCVTEAHATPYIGLWGLDEERAARSQAPFITLQAPMGQQLRLDVELLVDEGVVDQDTRVAVFGDVETTAELVDDNVVATLEDAGIEVVSSARLEETDDAVAAANEIDTIFQRFEQDGADTLLTVTGAGVVLPALQRTSWEPQLIVTNGQFTGEDSLGRYGLTDPAELVGARAAVAGVTSAELTEDPDLLACIDTINEHSDLDLAPTDIYPTALRPDSLGANHVVTACQLWNLTVQVLTAAGEDLSPQALVDGLAGLDDFSLPGYPELSLAPDQWGAIPGSRLWTYDEDEVRFLPDGPQESE
jgi:substrate-binding family protein